MNDKPVVLVLRGVIRNDEGKYLLMQRSHRSTSWPGYWEFPGGKVNPGEAHGVAFLREIKEETGLCVKPGPLFAELEWEREQDTVLYRIFMTAEVSGEFRMSEEHDEFGWFTLKEMAGLNISPPLLKIIKHL